MLGRGAALKMNWERKKELWARSKHCILCCASVQNAVHKMPTRRHKSINFWTWTLVPSFLFAYVHRESVHEPFLFMVPTKERHRARGRERDRMTEQSSVRGRERWKQKIKIKYDHNVRPTIYDQIDGACVFIFDIAVIDSNSRRPVHYTQRTQHTATSQWH